MASTAQLKRVRSRSKFRGVGGKKRKGVIEGRKMVVKPFSQAHVTRLIIAAKRKTYGVGAKAQMVMRDRRKTPNALMKRKKRKYT